jgi:hypothetical protein
MTMYTATLPGRQLAVKFQSLGDMTGKTLSQIVSIVGPPNARSFMAHSQVLYQWHATGYHIALLFDANEKMIRISSEHANVHNPDANDVASGIGSLIGVLILVVGLVAVFARHC